MLTMLYAALTEVSFSNVNFVSLHIDAFVLTLLFCPVLETPMYVKSLTIILR